MTSVLLTDSQQRKTLSTMRSLGRKGIKSDCCETFSCNLSRFSKYSRDFYLNPSARENPEGFLDFLLAYISKEESPVIFPMDDDTMKIFIDNSKLLEGKSKIAIPPKESFCLALKKDLAIKHAQEKGIPCPLSVSSGEYKEIYKAVCKMKFPLIIKAVDSSGSRGMKIVEKRENFEKEYKGISQNYPFPVVQEFLSVSEKIDVCLIYNKKSQLRGCFVQRELRNYPDPIGPSTIQESIIHDMAKSLALKFMEGLNWQGIVELEFIIEKESKDIVFMEVNPRFWASVEMAVQAGVDFPYMYYLIAKDGDCDEVMKYKIGGKVKWSFPGELLAFLETKKKKGVDPSFFFNKEIKDDTLSLDDPMPIFGLFFSSLYYISNSKRRSFILRR